MPGEHVVKIEVEEFASQVRGKEGWGVLGMGAGEVTGKGMGNEAAKREEEEIERTLERIRRGEDDGADSI